MTGIYKCKIYNAYTHTYHIHRHITYTYTPHAHEHTHTLCCSCHVHLGMKLLGLESWHTQGVIEIDKKKRTSSQVFAVVCAVLIPSILIGAGKLLGSETRKFIPLTFSSIYLQ